MPLGSQRKVETCRHACPVVLERHRSSFHMLAPSHRFWSLDSVVLEQLMYEISSNGMEAVLPDIQKLKTLDFEGHLGCFQDLAITNNVAMNIVKQMSFGCECVSFGYSDLCKMESQSLFDFHFPEV
ncbi:hypothetical protein H671_21438 [Cricetulus griseus]|nr:hypothetical protein H671_21438 [Cricetulus griseus]